MQTQDTILSFSNLAHASERYDMLTATSAQSLGNLFIRNVIYVFRICSFYKNLGTRGRQAGRLGTWADEISRLEFANLHKHQIVSCARGITGQINGCSRRDGYTLCLGIDERRSSAVGKEMDVCTLCPSAYSTQELLTSAPTYNT